LRQQKRSGKPEKHFDSIEGKFPLFSLLKVLPMAFVRERFPLPRFPQTVIPTFRSLCSAVSDEDAAQLISQLQAHLSQIEQDATTAPLLNVDLAHSIGRMSLYLLKRYPEFSIEHKALIIGAIRYFAFAEDALAESTFACGFDDDAKVMNYVLEKLGLEDRAILIA
jgi:hypothetical protein